MSCAPQSFTKGEQQLRGQIVDVEIKEGRKLCREGYEVGASLGKEHIK